MIKAILNYLITDSELTSLIGYTHKNKRINPYEAINKEDYPYITFEISPFLASDGLTQYRLDVRVLTKNVLLTESVSNRLLFLFHKKKSGFQSDGKLIYSSRHAGGSGIIYYPDYEVFEQTLTFNVKSN
jgi:hypothetical protein